MTFMRVFLLLPQLLLARIIVTEVGYVTEDIREAYTESAVYSIRSFEYGVQEERGPESQDATRTDIPSAQQAVPRMPPEGSYLRRHDHVWVHMYSVQRLSVSFP